MIKKGICVEEIWIDLLSLTIIFIVSTFVTTLRSCVLVVDVTADGNNNEVEETMEVGDIMMYPFS